MKKIRKFKYQSRIQDKLEQEARRDNIVLTIILSVGIVLSVVGLFI